MRIRRFQIALLVGSTVGAVIGGCRVERPNPDHCFFAQGDRTCAELDPASPYCAAPGCSTALFGCVAEIPEQGCYSACGEETLVEDDASCIEVADENDTDTGTETQTGSGTETETDAGDECMSHEDCPADLPYCLSGACTTCDDTPNPGAACYTLTEGQAEICLDGECVECTAEDAQACIDDASTCDTEAHACVPCTDHDQCAGGAGCDIALGLCLPPDAVWHVDGDGGQDFETIAAALAAIGAGSGTLIVHELDTAGYAEGVSVSGDRALAVLGAEAESPLLRMAPVSLEVLDGARVYARGLVLNGDVAARVTNGHLELDRMRLAPRLSYALTIEDASLRMDNSMLRGAFSMEPVVDIAGASDIDIRYSTVLSLGEGAALMCLGASLVPGSQIRNSILANLGALPAVQCASPAYAGNGLEDATAFTDNTTLGDATASWFQDLLLADLHLAIAAPVVVANAAIWSGGDPSVDFDGDPRPATPGSSDFAGADRL